MPRTVVHRAVAIVLLLLAATACGAAPPSAPPGPLPPFSSEPFGTTLAGTPVTRYTLTGARGMSVSFLDFGGTIADIRTPDRTGQVAPIMLGFPTVQDYENVNQRSQAFIGAVTGRYANYIGGGRFPLDGRTVQLPVTNPPNTLHGGPDGFDRKMWSVRELPAQDGDVRAELSLVSPDGDQGFPGTLRVRLVYALSPTGDFTITSHAETDRPTVVNLANHLNMNLAGAGNGTVLGHEYMVNADGYTATDPALLPTGAIAPVDGTPFDLRTPQSIGARVAMPDPQLVAGGGGYDINYVLSKKEDPARPQLAAMVRDPGSGRTVEVMTTQPGAQLYTGNWLDGSFSGVGGPYVRYAAFSIEAQHFPDSPNHPGFPSTELRPGQSFDNTTIYRFGVA